ncbi:hypothetical protein [Agromyces silvae]|uniref:hypothetical protein n=1 Tax=Agromyces silvae TaxID=3388266 RepID=UPI00280B7A61|nr:hypothetical protein [Agromyces protaetiae]
MSGMETTWVVFVVVADRNGSLTATTECFSTRGLGFEAVNTLDVDQGLGVLAFVFEGSARIALSLARTLGRLTAVHEVRLERADDPEVRALAHVPLEADAVTRALADHDVDTVAPSGAGGTIVEGTFASLRAAVEALRGDGVTGVTQTVLRPRDL